MDLKVIYFVFIGFLWLDKRKKLTASFLLTQFLTRGGVGRTSISKNSELPTSFETKCYQQLR